MRKRAFHTGGRSIWHWTTFSERWQTPDPSFPVEKAPVQLCLAQQHQRGGLVELQGRVNQHLGVLPCWSTTPTASSSTVSPHPTLILLHFLLCLFPDSPSSGDDEDDDDESEDTGNLFFWATEAFSLKELWLLSSAAHLGVHVVSLCVETSDLWMKPWWNLPKNLETAARVVLLLWNPTAAVLYLMAWCWESEQMSSYKFSLHVNPDKPTYHIYMYIFIFF